jgi:Rha family phage regulatory protein
MFGSKSGGFIKPHPLELIMGKLAPKRATRTTPRITLANGQPTTTSRDIAETFGKEHRVVLLRIRQLECSEEFRVHNFVQTPYTDPQNKQQYDEYHITKDGFAFLCMGFTGAKAAAWKERYIQHFNRMAEKLAKKQPKQPLPGKQPAQHAIKAIAHSSAQVPACQDHGPIDPLNPRNLPPLPDGLVWHPGIEQAIEHRTAELAMQAYPAIREYLRRHVAYTACNSHGQWADLSKQLQALEAATLQDAFAHQQSQAIQTAQSGLRAIQRVVQAALQEGAQA